MAPRIAFVYAGNSISNGFGGLLAAAIMSGMEGKAGLRGWRWLVSLPLLSPLVGIIATPSEVSLLTLFGDVFSFSAHTHTVHNRGPSHRLRRLRLLLPPSFSPVQDHMAHRGRAPYLYLALEQRRNG